MQLIAELEAEVDSQKESLQMGSQQQVAAELCSHVKFVVSCLPPSGGAFPSHTNLPPSHSS